MLAYSDAAWLDDRTSPSDRVRHNLEGLLDIFPAPYLLTFAVSTEAEPMADNGDGTSDIPVILRSRMSGLLGLSVRLGDMGDGSRASMAKQIDLYKRVRPILLDGVSFVLGPQQMSYAGRGLVGLGRRSSTSRRRPATPCSWRSKRRMRRRAPSCARKGSNRTSCIGSSRPTTAIWAP